MLIDSSSFHSLSNELILLRRLQEMVDTFPDSKHPLIHSKRRNSKRLGNAEPDARIDYVLNQDPELRDFLTNCGFDIDARLTFVEERVSAMRFATGHPDIACKQCGNYLFLPDSFLSEVGSYLERLTDDGG